MALVSRGGGTQHHDVLHAAACCSMLHAVSGLEWNLNFFPPKRGVEFNLNPPERTRQIICLAVETW